jgi:hypothetical protein
LKRSTNAVRHWPTRLDASKLNAVLVSSVRQGFSDEHGAFVHVQRHELAMQREAPI